MILLKMTSFLFVCCRCAKSKQCCITIAIYMIIITISIVSSFLLSENNDAIAACLDHGDWNVAIVALLLLVIPI